MHRKSFQFQFLLNLLNYVVKILNFTFHWMLHHKCVRKDKKIFALFLFFQTLTIEITWRECFCFCWRTEFFTAQFLRKRMDTKSNFLMFSKIKIFWKVLLLFFSEILEVKIKNILNRRRRIWKTFWSFCKKGNIFFFIFQS